MVDGGSVSAGVVEFLWKTRGVPAGNSHGGKSGDAANYGQCRGCGGLAKWRQAHTYRRSRHAGRDGRVDVRVQARSDPSYPGMSRSSREAQSCDELEQIPWPLLDYGALFLSADLGPLGVVIEYALPTVLSFPQPMGTPQSTR